MIDTLLYFILVLTAVRILSGIARMALGEYPKQVTYKLADVAVMLFCRFVLLVWIMILLID